MSPPPSAFSPLRWSWNLTNRASLPTPPKLVLGPEGGVRIAASLAYSSAVIRDLL